MPKEDKITMTQSEFDAAVNRAVKEAVSRVSGGKQFNRVPIEQRLKSDPNAQKPRDLLGVDRAALIGHCMTEFRQNPDVRKQFRSAEAYMYHVYETQFAEAAKVAEQLEKAREKLSTLGSEGKLVDVKEVVQT